MRGKCPKCQKLYYGVSAISREDNKTEICPICGVKEALEALRTHKQIKN